jgi:hypothetical protein
MKRDLGIICFLSTRQGFLRPVLFLSSIAFVTLYKLGDG